MNTDSSAAFAAGAQLHSRYNPQAEAVRYIESLNLKSSIECFILIEPGMGYLVPALREKFKDSKIIALHADNGFPDAGVPAIYGTDVLSVQNFLEKEVPQTEASNIKIIEWRPSLNFYGEKYLKLLSVVVEFIKRADAGNRTVAAFGKRWVKNFFKNLGNLNKVLLYKPAEIPVIVTGSGPSLEKAIPVIRSIQDSALILAASSSAASLAHNGITADLVIATDGGSWALKHIYPFYRNKKGVNAIAANLCAALPSQSGRNPLLILNDGSLWQSIILHELEFPSVLVPQRGTVTASAIDLALQLTSGNIYLAGLDLSVRDIRTHARPYGFDYILFDRACRTNPVYSQSFVRSCLIHGGGGFDIYKAWFKNQLTSWPKRIFSLCENEVFEYSAPQMLKIKKNTASYFKAILVDKKDSSNTANRAVNILLAALKNSGYRENLRDELIPMLFPNANEVTDMELETAIKLRVRD